MRRIAIGVSLGFLFGCGGAVTAPDTSSTGSGARAGASGNFAYGGEGGVSGDGGGLGGTNGGDVDGAPPYRDPSCPPETRVQGYYECDVSASTATCPTGYQCVPTVTYGEKCHTEEIGTRCAVAGTAAQGDDCTVADCAAGFVCVSGGTGYECAALCHVQSDCPPGLLCAPLDVDGYGVCG